MSIELTTAAIERVQSHLTKRGKGLGLRLGVKETGCSGFSYVIDYADESQPDDVVFEDFPIKVFVEKTSLPYLDGVTVDFVKTNLGSQFTFNNPNSSGECGCGESFTV